MERKEYDCIIVGGGASGLVCGIEASMRGLSTLILEQKEKLNKKLYATGNGKCNYLHADCRLENYYTKEEDLFKRIMLPGVPEELKLWFMNLGIHPLEKGDYLYPHSENAASVADALQTAYREYGGEWFLKSKVREIKKDEGKFFVSGSMMQEDAKEEKFEFVSRYLVLAAGGKSSSKFGSDGSGYRLVSGFRHNVEPCVPALCGLKCKGDFERLQGVRAQAVATLSVDQVPQRTEIGEIQFTKYGLSGIAVFNFSRIAAYGLNTSSEVTVTLDLLSNLDMQLLYDSFVYMRECMPGRTISSAFRGILPEKLSDYLLSLNSIRPQDAISTLSDRDWKKWYNFCREWKTTVEDTNHFENSQVTAGGVPLSEVHIETMESKMVNGLYLTGELLDVDGICGGYNLMWAWKTGLLAGRGIG